MSTEDQTPEEQQTKKPRSSLSWFPKVFLWGSVLAFGYLYLDSIDYFKRFENLSLDNLDETLLSALDRAPQSSVTDTAAQADSAPAAEPAEADRVAATPAPAAVSAAVAETAPAPQASLEPAPQSSGAAPFSAPVAMPAPMEPPAMAARPSEGESLAEQRARLMADYEAMRRAAEERMREHWEQMRAAAPPVAVMPPPGYYYPAYAPAPGYYPPAYPTNPAAAQ